MSKDMRYKFDFHLEMDPERPGYYQVKKCFEQDKHIFPAGGRLDKSCAERLLEARTGKPVALQPVSPPPPSNGDIAQQAPVSWSQGPDGAYNCPGEPTAEDFRAVFKLLQDDMRSESVTMAIRAYDANKDLIELLPEAGRRNLESLYNKRVKEI